MCKWRFFLLLLFGSAVISCAINPKYITDDFHPPRTVALLPVANQSNDLNAPELVRKLMLEVLVSKGYEVKPLDTTDEILKKNGISEGGQLNAVTPEKLGKELDVGGLFYGEIIEYNFINVGVYRNRVVEIDYKLVDPQTGKMLWEDQRKVSNKQFEFDQDKMVKSLALGLAEKVIENLISSPLLPECKAVINKIARTLPQVYGDSSGLSGY
ncbi:MAG: GNA1162 family protein [bacterium]